MAPPKLTTQAMLARMEEKIQNIERTQKLFVTRHEFNPVKAIAYGIAFLVLTGVGAALIKLVIK